MAPLMALVLTVMLGTAAMAVDMGQLTAAKGELKRAVDAGAMAGARALWPLGLPVMQPNELNPNIGVAHQAAVDTVLNISNQVAGERLSQSNVRVEVGRWDYETRTFTVEGGSTTNAVKVSATRDNITLIFAKVLGITTGGVQATSTAIMDWASGIPKGGLPIAINKRFATPNNRIFINFSPDPLDNGGWFAEPPDPASSRTFRDYIENGTCPPLNIGDMINLDNGVDTSALQALRDKLVECQSGGVPFDTFLPVVLAEQFNHTEPIDNFVSFRIDQVNTTGSDKGVWGTVVGLATCNYGEPGGRSINSLTGLLAPPKLVN